MPIIIILYFAYRLFVQVLLFSFLRRPKSSNPSHLAGISILVPLKGIPRHLENAFKALMQQSYEGNLELIIAIKEESDPALAETRRLAELYSSKVRVRWVVGDFGEGLNPKNSNLKRAYDTATHSWIYTSDADTIPSLKHLSDLMCLTANDPNKFATGHSIYKGAHDLGAMLEGIGTNFEATGFFLISDVFLKGRTINGASMFFHKELLIKVGGMEICLNTITDDLLFANLFIEAGARGYLAPKFVTVELENESLKDFFNRYTRWMLIARTLQPSLFFLAPFSWVGIWCLLTGLITGNQNWFFWSGIVFLARVIECFFIQTFIGAKSDRMKSWVIALYDIVIPFLWFRAIFKNKVYWNNQVLSVKRDGHLVLKGPK